MNNRMLRFLLPMPDKNSEEFTRSYGGRRKRSPEASAQAWEQSTRQRWRALALVIKAKLEAVECGIVNFESEFLAHIVIPGSGQTVGETMVPQLEDLYKTKRLPQLLPGMKS